MFQLQLSRCVYTTTSNNRATHDVINSRNVTFARATTVTSCALASRICTAVTRGTGRAKRAGGIAGKNCTSPSTRFSCSSRAEITRFARDNAGHRPRGGALVIYRPEISPFRRDGTMRGGWNYRPSAAAATANCIECARRGKFDTCSRMRGPLFLERANFNGALTFRRNRLR